MNKIIYIIKNRLYMLKYSLFFYAYIRIYIKMLKSELNGGKINGHLYKKGT